MKIAFLFSGQLRNIPIDLFRNSLRNLTDGLDYDIYLYLWDKTGKSLNHSKYSEKFSNNDESSYLINHLFEGFNIARKKYESFENFKKDLNPKHLKVFKSNKYHFGTVNSLPQIYSLSKCFKLLNNNLNKYDLIFKCRFDSLFVHPLNLYDLSSIKTSKKLYSLNFGRAYYPKRVYDIFFGGSREAMMFLSDIWENTPNLVKDKFNNNLDQRDCCRILYLAAKKNKIDVTSFETRICDIFRNFENNYYEKYLISMHLISLRKIYKSFSILFIFYKWFKYRNLNELLILLYFLKSILILPFSYLKRIKYLKIIKKLMVNNFLYF